MGDWYGWDWKWSNVHLSRDQVRGAFLFWQGRATFGREKCDHIVKWLSDNWGHHFTLTCNWTCLSLSRGDRSMNYQCRRIIYDSKWYDPAAISSKRTELGIKIDNWFFYVISELWATQLSIDRQVIKIETLLTYRANWKIFTVFIITLPSFYKNEKLSFSNLLCFDIMSDIIYKACRWY
jgi:hypothetical protein